MEKSKTVRGVVRKIEKIKMSEIKEPEFIARLKIDRGRIEELAESIEKDGLIMPILVKRKGKGIEVIAGHRRYLAHKFLGKQFIEGIIDSGTESALEIKKMQENMMREDLSDVEEAMQLSRLKEITKRDDSEIGRRIGKSGSYVKQKIAIMKYPEFLFSALQEREITFSAARELARIDDIDICRDYVRHAVKNGITPAQAKAWADSYFEMKRQDLIIKNDAVDQQGVGGAGVVLLPCDFCMELQDYTTTRMMRVCSDCVAEHKVFKRVEEEVEAAGILDDKGEK